MHCSCPGSGQKYTAMQSSNLFKVQTEMHYLKIARAHAYHIAVCMYVSMQVEMEYIEINGTLARSAMHACARCTPRRSLLPHALGRPHGWRVGAALDEEKAAREGAEGEKRSATKRRASQVPGLKLARQARRIDSHPHRTEQGAACGPAYFILAKRRSASSLVKLLSMHRRRGARR